MSAKSGKENPTKPEPGVTGGTRPSHATPTTGAGKSDDYESWLLEAAQPDAPPQVLLPRKGQVISGKYRIEQELGKGGMGAVYRATHVVSDKQVALKWMFRPATDERAKQRFTREARAAGRIDHPGVVDVYDIGEEGDAAYLVMELLRGEALSSRLSRGRLGITEAIDLLLPAMRGVAAAHRQGVIHRDLKPENIFLCAGPEGDQREAKVLDFGISTINAPDSGSESTLTKEGTLLGTPAYMSPEQLESPNALDSRTDIYALGVILYQCLTGKLPFEAETYSALILAIARDAPISLRKHRAELPAELEAVVLRALSKQREQRFASVDEFIAALAAFSSAPTTAGDPVAAASVARKPRSRVAVVAALALLVVVGLAALWRSLSQAPETLADTPKSPIQTEQRAAAPTPPMPDAVAASAAAPEPEVTPTTQPKSAPEPVRSVSTAPPRTTAPAAQIPTKRPPPKRPVTTPKTAKPQRPGRSGSISLEDL